MVDISKPNLNQKERWARDYILPLLPSSFNQPADVEEERLEIARSILAKQYVKHGNLDVLWKTFAILLMYDVGFRLNSMVYGLVLGVLGSLLLALPNLYTPELLAEDAFHEPSDLSSRIEAKAERSVKTNLGVAGLSVGFLWQIFTSSGSIPPELVSQNYLQGVMTNWQGFALALILGYLLLGTGISDIRDWI